MFDAVVIHTVLSHVPDPVAVLVEATRLMKSGGRLIVFDAAHEGTTYGQPDFETTLRIDHFLSSAIANDPDVCRQMHRYLKQAGFQLKNYGADVIAECGQGNYSVSSVRGTLRSGVP